MYSRRSKAINKYATAEYEYELRHYDWFDNERWQKKKGVGSHSQNN
jgi:hypothetical protein